MKHVFFVIGFMFIASTTHAIDTTPPIPEPTVDQSVPVIFPLKMNDPAPFDGVELSAEGVATIITNIHLKDEEMKLNIDKAVADANAQGEFKINELKSQLSLDKSVSDARIKSLDAQNNALNVELKKAIDDQSNVPLLLGIGFAGGVVVSVLLTLALTHSL